MDANAYVVRQEIRFLHNTSLKREAGAQHSLSPVVCLGSSTVIGTTFAFRVPVRCSISLSFLAHEGACSIQPLSDRRDLSTTIPVLRLATRGRPYSTSFSSGLSRKTASISE